MSIETSLVEWPLGSAADSGEDVWALSWTEGARAARRRERRLEGRDQLERFNPQRDLQGRLWPPTFEFSPLTGEALTPALEQLTPTSGRYGSAAGLPLLDVPERSLAPEQPIAEALPKGAFYFAQGGAPGFLFAADLRTGFAFRKSRLESGWIAHGRYPRSHLEPWAGGLAGTSDAVYYSGETGLVRLNEDAEDDGAETWSLGPMASAPAVFADGVAAPFKGEAGPELAWLVFGGAIRRLPVRPVGEATFDAMLGSPCIGAGGVAYWIGASGFLSFEITRDGGEAVWRAWPPGFAGKPFLRPYRTANGALYAFGVLTGEGERGRAAVAELGVGEGARPVRSLEGPHVSAGEATYRNRQRYARPWGEPTETVQPGKDMEDRWLLPLVTLPGGETVVALVEEVAGMRAFLFRDGPTRTRAANIFLHRPQAGLTSMGHSMDLTSTDEIDVFASDGRLCLYHREEHACVSWPLV